MDLKEQRALQLGLAVLLAWSGACGASDDDDEAFGAGTGGAALGASGSGGAAGSTMAGSISSAGSTAAGQGAAGTMMVAAGMGGTMMAGGAGAAGMVNVDAGSGDDGGTIMPPDDGGSVMMGPGMCCSDGNCLCHGPEPTGLTSDDGPYDTDSYTISGVGCVYYPTDAEPPFAAVAVSDGFLGSGGCGSFQTGAWGPLYASWGIVAMIINTTGSDQPATRGRKLTAAIEAYKAENDDSSSPLYQKLAGRYGTSGFSMGGGGTTYSAQDDASLLTNVAIMPWGPVDSGIEVPTLIICGASDGTASCSSHGTPAYRGIPDSTPKMRVQVSGGHNGQPSAGGGRSGEYGLAFQKVFLENDERWRPLLVAAESEETNIQ